jgi:membrane protease YdiL (CAAX protease family)
MSTDSSKPVKNSGYTVAVTVQTIIIGLLLYIIPPVIASFLLVIGAGASGKSASQIDDWFNNAASAQFIYVLITETIVMASLYQLLGFLKESWHGIGVRRPKLRDIPYTIGGFFTYYVIYIVIAMVISQVINLDFEQRQEIGFNTDTSGGNMLFAFAALVILPPLVEEILFRGFLYTRFKRVLSVRWAALAVSLLFGAAHLQFGSGNALLWVAAIDTFVLSMVLVYIREKTGTIWAGVGVHALKNLVAFIFLFNLM